MHMIFHVLYIHVHAVYKVHVQCVCTPPLSCKLYMYIQLLKYCTHMYVHYTLAYVHVHVYYM